MIAHVNATTRIPAIQGQFGPRVVTYSTQLPVGSIETILGHDPRSGNWKRLPADLAYIYNHLQRATTKARLDSIIRYIRYRFIERPIIIGAFPAISIAVQNQTPFTPYAGETAVGALEFDLSKRNHRVLVDGLGRVGAGLELLDMTEDDKVPEHNREALRGLMSQFSLPAVFYIPAPGNKGFDLEEMQQLFHDFNFKAKSVPERVAIALDHSDLYIGLANRIGGSPLMKRLGGMEFKSASLGKKSTAIVVQQNLLRFVRGAAEGERFLEGTNKSEIEDPNLTEDTLDDLEERMLVYLEAVVEGMGDEKFKDREGLHLTSPGWGALGVLFNDLVVRLKVPDYQAAARKIGTIDWNRANLHWADIVRENTDKHGNVSLGLAKGGAQNRRFLTRRLRQLLGVDTLLEERGFEPEHGDHESAPVVPELVPA
ncbi:MAG TPA: DNA sulfur modification protein DndB [Stellaceae bacterium]|nr:DNA sulfur modification protein DndB [Stellaceae bacterium]